MTNPILNSELCDSLNSAVSRHKTLLIKLTKELVAFPTVNPPGRAYEPCAKYVGNWMADLGFSVEYVRGHGTPGDSDEHPRTNVICRIEGKSGGACVHFNSHIDVVEVGEGWSVDPFAGVEKDGKIYGRGTCDMKGGLAASMIAIKSYLECNPDFSGAIELSGTVDEESGGFGGVAYLAEKGYFSKPKVDHVIIPEPLHKDRICLGHRGAWWAEIETHGKQAHGSMPFLGDCAVRHMGALIDAFETKLYPELSKKKTQMPVIPEGAKQSTMNINAIHGGPIEPKGALPSPNVVDRCKMVIDRRFLLEESLEVVKSEVVTILEELKSDRPNFNYAIKDLMEIIPTMTDEDAPVVNAIGDAIEAVLGKKPEMVISPGSYDQKHMKRIGHLEDCIAYGPGILDLAHQPDEYIVIEDMLESAEIMARALHVLLHENI